MGDDAGRLDSDDNNVDKDNLRNNIYNKKVKNLKIIEKFDDSDDLKIEKLEDSLLFRLQYKTFTTNPTLNKKVMDYGARCNGTIINKAPQKQISIINNNNVLPLIAEYSLGITNTLLNVIIEKLEKKLNDKKPLIRSEYAQKMIKIHKNFNKLDRSILNTPDDKKWSYLQYALTHITLKDIILDNGKKLLTRYHTANNCSIQMNGTYLSEYSVHAMYLYIYK